MTSTSTPGESTSAKHSCQSSYEVIVSSPKNHQARVIDIDPATVEQLRAHRVRQQRERDEWGTDYEDNDLVFCKENGTPIHPQTFTQAFERHRREVATCQGSGCTISATRTPRSPFSPACR